MSNSKILFFISGSIAAYKAADVISKLVQKNCDVQVVFSRSAEKFVGPMTFEGLTGRTVLKDIFEEGQAMAHIDLARWADLFVLCPASAQKLSDLAAGSAADLVSSLFLAKAPEIPALIFPAMNTTMWNHPFVQKNKRALESLPNTTVIEPDSGNLACGEIGAGRLPETEYVLKEIEQSLSKTGTDKSIPIKSSNLNKRLLITGGGTVEPIDSVRSITNTSTGETASKMADFFTAQGYQVDLLLSKTARFSPRLTTVTGFDSHKDLSEKLQQSLSARPYDGVIHLAAVSDFTIEKTEGKISSNQESLILNMKSTSKIIRHLREWSKNKKVFLLGFKLSADSPLEERKTAAQELIRKNDLNGVVSNDLRKISKEGHIGFLLNTKNEMKNFRNKPEMFRVIQEFMEEAR